MIKHTPYIIEYPGFVNPRTTGFIQEQASTLLKFDPKNTTFHRKNRGYHLGEWKHVDGMQELNYEIDKIGKKAFMRYYKDCPLIAYSIIQSQGFISNYVYRFYDKSDHYNWHVDAGPGESATRKISFTVQLSDPNEYEECNLLVLDHSKEIQAIRDQGSLSMFPSYMPHCVTPIKSGERWALVIWVHGPNPFR